MAEPLASLLLEGVQSATYSGPAAPPSGILFTLVATTLATIRSQGSGRTAVVAQVDLAIPRADGSRYSGVILCVLTVAWVL